MKNGKSQFAGRMNDPDASAYIRGACGDEMEFYLVIKELIIKDIRFHADGCEYTDMCAHTAAGLAIGRTIKEAMNLSPGMVVDGISGLPDDHLHCAILAVMTLHKALGDYLVRYASS